MWDIETAAHACRKSERTLPCNGRHLYRVSRLGNSQN
jgi:hypothetical protein